jgi:hypothetical protein
LSIVIWPRSPTLLIGIPILSKHPYLMA